MLKNMGRVLCVIGMFLILGAPHVFSGEIQQKLSASGEARFRYELRDNTDLNSGFPDHASFIGTRIRLNVDFAPTENVKAFVQPQFSGVWGQITSNVQGNGTLAGGLLTSGSLTDPALSLHQGYVLWKFSEPADLKLGRQEIAYGDQMVVGSVGFSNVGRSFDSIRFHLFGEKSWIEPFFSVLGEDDVKNSGVSGNMYFAGAYGSLGGTNPPDAADAYVFWLFDNRAGAPPTFNFATVGTRLVRRIGGADGRLEANLQLGKHSGNSMRAYMADAEAGYTFPLMDGLHLGVEYNRASGDNPADSTFTRYHQLFPTAHRWLGYMDLFGRQNIQSGVFHGRLKINPEWSTSADVHSFWRVEEQDVVYSIVTETPFAGQPDPPTMKKKHVGEEFDMVLAYRPTEFAEIEAMGGLFLPGGYLKATVGNDVSYFSYVQVSFKL